MSETPVPEMPRRLLTDLCRLVAERAGVEEEINSGLAARNEAAEKEYHEGQRLLDERYRLEKAKAEEEYASTRAAAVAKFESEHSALSKEYETVRDGSARPLRRRPAGCRSRRCKTRIGKRWRRPTPPAAA